MDTMRPLRLAKDAMDRDWADPDRDLAAVAGHAGYSRFHFVRAGAFRTDDCRGDYETFRARGVEFIQEPQEPQERPYGIEAIFRDDNGNRYSLTERSEELDFSKDFGC
ncbi:MAG TPA: hypothetical protein VK545_13240 [Streptomyces sp.]|nr:hypothetical protein [Streptomyces sp.]